MMTSSFILTTSLKTRDAVAETALHTLTYDMQYGGKLLDLKREDYWKIDLETEDPDLDPKTKIVELAEKTRVFVNINKHFYTIHTVGSELFQPRRNADGTCVLHILVRNRDDRNGRDALKTLQALYSAGKIVRNVENGVLWKLTIRADTEKKAGIIAEEITRTVSRERGLLANHHYQEVSVL